MAKAMTGIAWYTEEQFTEMSEICADMRDTTYAEWLEAAEEAWARDAEPMNLTKVTLDPEAFRKWCRETHNVPGPGSRKAYIFAIAKLRSTRAIRAAKAAKSKKGWRAKPSGKSKV